MSVKFFFGTFQPSLPDSDSAMEELHAILVSFTRGLEKRTSGNYIDGVGTEYSSTKGCATADRIWSCTFGAVLWVPLLWA